MAVFEVLALVEVLEVLGVVVVALVVVPVWVLDALWWEPPPLVIRITATTTITTSAASSSAPPRLELGSELEKLVSRVRLARVGAGGVGGGRRRRRLGSAGDARCPSLPCWRASWIVWLARLLREGVERGAGAIADGALGNAEHLRDLGVALALADQQQQHRALVGGKVV